MARLDSDPASGAARPTNAKPAKLAAPPPSTYNPREPHPWNDWLHQKMAEERAGAAPPGTAVEAMRTQRRSPSQGRAAEHRQGHAGPTAAGLERLGMAAASGSHAQASARSPSHARPAEQRPASAPADASAVVEPQQEPPGAAALAHAACVSGRSPVYLEAAEQRPGSASAAAAQSARALFRGSLQGRLDAAAAGDAEMLLDRSPAEQLRVAARETEQLPSASLAAAVPPDASRAAVGPGSRADAVAAADCADRRDADTGIGSGSRAGAVTAAERADGWDADSASGGSAGVPDGGGEGHGRRQLPGGSPTDEGLRSNPASAALAISPIAAHLAAAGATAAITAVHSAAAPAAAASTLTTVPDHNPDPSPVMATPAACAERAACAGLPSLAQIDASVWAELPESVQRDLLRQRELQRRRDAPARAPPGGLPRPSPPRGADGVLRCVDGGMLAQGRQCCPVSTHAAMRSCYG